MPVRRLQERVVAGLTLAASVLDLAACGSDESPCLLILSAAAVISVTDAKTDTPVCDADVTVSVDGKTFAAEESDSPCGDYAVWSAELDRDLQLVVEADGFRSYVTSIRVPKGRCGPETQNVDVKLNPN